MKSRDELSGGGGGGGGWGRERKGYLSHKKRTLVVFSDICKVDVIQLADFVL